MRKIILSISVTLIMGIYLKFMISCIYLGLGLESRKNKNKQEGGK